jgi:hypothetical protein
MRSFESITRLILTNSELNTHGNRAEDLDWDRGWLEAQLCSGQIKARQVPQTLQRPPVTSWRCWRTAPVDRDIWVGHTLHLICTGPHFADRVVRWCYLSRAMTRATCVGVHKRSPRIVLLPCDLQSWGRGFESLRAHHETPYNKRFLEQNKVWFWLYLNLR